MPRTTLALPAALGLLLALTARVATEPAPPEPAPSELEKTVAFLSKAITPDQATIDYLARVDLLTGLVPKPGESLGDTGDGHGRLLPPDALCTLDCDTPQHLAVSPDGHTMAAGRFICAPSISLCDRFTGKHLKLIWEGGDVSAIAFSPDGKLLAAAVCRSGTNRRTQGRVYLWDVASRRLLPDFAVVLPATSVAFHPDGESLVVGDEDGQVTLWSLDTGEKIRDIGVHERLVGSVAAAPDGRTVASASSDGTVRLWDVATGKERQCLKHPGEVRFVTFSPDGRHLASIVGSDRFSPGQVLVWNADTGTELPHFGHRPAAWGEVAFSPDGRLLASTAKTGIHIWEIATGLERLKLDRFTENSWGGLTTVAFSADGRAVAGGGTRTWLWDVTGRSPAGQLEEAKFTPAGLEALWNDLGSGTASTAHAAIWALIAGREGAAAYLRSHLPPASAVDLERVKKLIANLDDDQFEVRQRASQELEKLDDTRVADLLRQLLADKPPLELQRRAERVLAQVTGASHSQRIRALRAIEVLEHIGTPEAREALALLAKSAPSSYLTRVAQTALDRLKARSDATE